jgi:hypothetical protein
MGGDGTEPSLLLFAWNSLPYLISPGCQRVSKDTQLSTYTGDSFFLDCNIIFELDVSGENAEMAVGGC